MKKLVSLLVLVVGFTFSSFAQDVKTVSLQQTDGEFTVKELKLSEGTYVFEIENTGVDHEVGFVLAPEGKTDQAHHIKNAYVQNRVKKGATESSKEVTLLKGTYVYFCPLNPTPQYILIVE